MDVARRAFECVRDGLTIRGTEYRPAGTGLPVAIVSHGFIAWQDTVRQYAKLFASLGYAAYCFDFCGGSVMCGKSDGKTTGMSVLTEQKDLETVLAYVRSLPYVDATNVTLMGCSQGGLVSGLVAARHPGGIRRLVMFYPALCIPDDARNGKMIWATFDPHNIPDVMRCGPMKIGRCFAADVMQMDVFAELQPYDGRVLIVHGTKDAVVDPQYSERARAAYLATKPAAMTDGQRVQLEWITDGRHGFSKKHDKQAMAILTGWLGKQ